MAAKKKPTAAAKAPKAKPEKKPATKAKTAAKPKAAAKPVVKAQPKPKPKPEAKPRTAKAVEARPAKPAEGAPAATVAAAAPAPKPETKPEPVRAEQKAAVTIEQKPAPTPERTREHVHEHKHDREDVEEGKEKKEFKFVEDPIFDISVAGECAYQVKVTVPVANRAHEAGTMYEELQHEAEIPGFRRGRAPRKLIERKFSKHVKSEVDGKLVNEAFRKLVKDKEFKPIRLPDIEGLDDKAERKDDEPLVFTLKFEVSPKVELGKYRGIAVERPVVTVTDKDVDEALEELRMRYATFETLADGVAAAGDQVIIDFTGTVEGAPFPGGSANNYPYILGTKRFFEEFESALLGSSAGNRVSCKVTLPEDSRNAHLRGKEATFEIAVHEVKRRQVPALTEDFANQVGAKDLDALREQARERLRQNSRATSEAIARRRALDAVIDSSRYEIPNGLVDALTDEIHREEVERLVRARVPVEQIEQRSDEIKAAARENAVREIKQLVTLNEIGEAEGVEVTEEDFEAETTILAARTGLDLDRIQQYFSEQQDRRRTHEARIIREKALRVIMENAVITDKEVPAEQFEEGQQ
jgi:trigger factor